ncbi:hypothetical protein M569_06284 [Genlisea aurea]|uniref:Uncharacterized protein n=1 Tax=Genlisea aurea TaxID=192259 RepID=S8CMU2_9LAMI|nr:hypothetical protein M569_06284 [Genlisea aurea]
MGKHPSTTKIMRKSIFLFLRNIHLFSSSPALLAVPYSAAVLLFPPLVSSSSSSSAAVFPALRNRLDALSPPLARVLAVALVSSLFAFPLAISSLLLAKTRAVGVLKDEDGRSLPLPVLVAAQLCGSSLRWGVDAACLCALFVGSDLMDDLGFSSRGMRIPIAGVGAVLYSILMSNACIVSNLSAIVCMCSEGGVLRSILGACRVGIGGGAAIRLAMPMNVGLAGVEALFRYRVVRGYGERGGTADCSLVVEGMFIAYLYSLLLVLDTVVGFVLLKSFREGEEEEDGRLYGGVKMYGNLLLVMDEDFRPYKS